MRYRLKKDIFPVGTILDEGPEKHEAFGPMYVVDVGISNDHVVSLYVDKETVDANPDYFEPVTDDGSGSAG